ncbi:bifunctional (p)ppGpp synthetase/guanosine-3',5'-bis(diphosphate) 3'-pyrophosphohydrolase [Candidatus Woesearchaeota archaeon]|nr:bifunctional (p)ppGpp synthetase/guanosine-3',5'-bis(diphosphate) 3'-pyrophosphohydrolase [Candidatus Woesearchaeota archaeon]
MAQMMTCEEFLGRVKEYNPSPDLKMLRRAYEVSKEAHKDQKRSTGDPYFIHPLGVAEILMKLKAGSATLSAALLHDVVEETSWTIKDIEKEFGADVAGIVDGLTKIDKVHFETKEDYTAENLRKVLLATTKDIRIMLVKLADRLNNMQTLSTFRPEKRQRIAQETLDIYAPIAHKLGMGWIQGELEDLSLRYLQPEVYQYLKKRINQKRAEREQTTEEIINRIKGALEKKGVNALVTGRAKYFMSIYKKMIKKNLDIDEIYDLIAIRILVKNIKDCYTALGIVHELWKPIPRRFKDYIANPKGNGYQSLHTGLEGPLNKIIEVQIRTEEQHHFAEDGVAAHWRYHGTDRDKKFDQKISWLKQILEWGRHSENAQDFIETLKLDLFEDEIVVFTPKGDPITLREGATPIDFAYEVHTAVGNHCSKALVNGKAVALNTVLKPGEVVEIITSKNAKPSRQWLNFVVSTKAKSKIRGELGISIEADTKHDAESLFGEPHVPDLLDYDKRLGQLKVSKCCSPEAGDAIVAYQTKDKKVTVHRKDCANVFSIQGGKEIPIKWKKIPRRRMLVIITLEDKEGILTKVLDYFVHNRLVIRNVNTRHGKEHLFNIFLEVEEPDITILDTVVKNLRAQPEVINVTIRH